MSQQNNWNKVIPWYITGICTIALILVSLYLYNNLEWFKTSAVNNEELMANANYRIFLYSTHLSILKRSLGILTGIAITFIGLGVSFYALEKTSDVELSGFAKISTVSPGIIAIILGCFLISQSINSKDSMTFKPKTDNQTLK